MSVDPITSQYPELTPYQFASNTPIQGTDLDGLEISYHYDDPRFGMVITPAGDNLQRRIPPEHLKFLPQQKNKRSQGIMGEGASLVLDNLPVVGTVKGAIEGVVGYDAAGNKLSILQRSTGFVPYIGKAKKTLRVLKAADKADEVNDLTRAANRVDDAVSNEKALVKHKNSNDAEGEFMLYDLHAQPDKQGKLLKIGKADEERKRASGIPVRMADSQRKARKAGYPDATATPRKKLGRTTTEQAKEAEAAEVRAERAAGNELPLNKEKGRRYRND